MCSYPAHANFTVAFLLWFFFGLLGFHRLYLGKPLSFLLYFFTGGLFGIGWIVDLFFLPAMVDDYNDHFHERTTFIIAPQPISYSNQYP